MKITPIKDWAPAFDEKTTLLIAGPCSAESEEQVLSVAKDLKEKNLVHIFRSGIWKPRTRPNTFEGVGEAGLPWLKRVKEEYGIPVAVEVATPAHIDLALKYGVDILWIGARTSVNPFAVQEIADRLRGIDIPVMVKNPINADLALWIGALERISQAGITKLAAIHRGFSTTEESVYRNAPLWEIPIELKRRYPELPIICDPSHIAGKRDLLGNVSQKAMDIGINGLMIETHPTPEKALSDAAQQVTPLQLENLYKTLTFKTEYSKNPDYTEDISTLRSKIDQLDQELIDCLAARMDVVRRMAKSKIKNKITAFQVNRMGEMLNQRIDLAKQKNLDEKYINELFHVIHTESVRLQTKIMSENSQSSEEK